MKNQKIFAKIDKYPDEDYIHQMLAAGVNGLVVAFPHSSLAWLAETLDHLHSLFEQNKHLGLMLEFDFSQSAMVELEFARAVGVKWIAVQNFQSLMELQAIKRVLGKDTYLIPKLSKQHKLADVLKIADGAIISSQNFKSALAHKHIFVEAENNSIKPQIGSAQIDGVILENPTPVIVKRVEKILAKGKLINQLENPSEERLEILAHNLLNIVKHTDPQAIVTTDFAFARALALQNSKIQIVLLSSDHKILANAAMVRKIRVAKLHRDAQTSLKNHRLLDKGDRFVDATSPSHPEIAIMS